MKARLESETDALEQARQASKAIKDRVKDAMRAKLAENKELAARAEAAERRAEELQNTQTALRQVAGDHADAAEESKLLEKEVRQCSIPISMSFAVQRFIRRHRAVRC